MPPPETPGHSRAHLGWTLSLDAVVERCTPAMQAALLKILLRWQIQEIESTWVTGGIVKPWDCPTWKLDLTCTFVCAKQVSVAFLSNLPGNAPS